MKFSTSLLVALPLIASQVVALAVPEDIEARQNFRGRQGQGRGRVGGQRGRKQGNQGNQQGGAKGGAAAGGKGAAGGAAGGAAAGGAAGAAGGAAAGGAAGAAGGAAAGGAAGAAGGAAAGGAGGAAGGAAAGGAGGAAGGAAAGGKGGDPQTSLTLDPGVIAKGFANDGQDVPADGQVRSLTSTNNFINFCLTAKGLPLTDGKQIKTGSCNPAPIGIIPSTDNMPSAKFVFPKNLDNINENEAFTVQMAVAKFETGNFVNAQENYFAAPQQVNKAGQIIGHSHVVIEKMEDGLGQTKPTDPNVFAFFKGLNAPAANGILTAAVDKGLPAGTYRLASINTAANHQPCIVPVAQHGTLDDAVYFTVGAAAKADALKFAGANNAAAAGGAAGGAAAGGAAGAAGGAAAGAAAGAAKNGAAAGAVGGAAAGAAAGAAKNGAAAGAANAAGAAKNGAQAAAGAAKNGAQAGAAKNGAQAAAGGKNGAQAAAAAKAQAQAAAAAKAKAQAAAAAQNKNRKQGGRRFVRELN